MASAEGRRELSRLKEALLKEEARRWLQSDEAQSKLEELKPHLIAPKACELPDVFERACKEAIAKQVAEWLQSPVGQEAIDQERTRTLQEEAKSKRDSWISRLTNQVKAGG